MKTATTPLLWNPHVRVRIEEEAPVGRVLTFSAPVRGRPLQPHNVEERTRAQSFARFRKLFAPRSYGKSALPRDLDDILALRRLGVLVAPDEVSRPVRYEARLAASGRPAPRGASLVGDMWLQEGEELPPAARGVDLSAISRRRPVVWHRTSAARPLLPIWPDRTLVEQIRSLCDRRELRSADRALCDVGILADGRSRAGEGLRSVDETRREFARRGAVVLASALPSPHVEGLAAYYAKLADEGWLALGDGHSRRFVAYNEPVGRMVQAALFGFTEGVVGQPLKPSYTYFAGYRQAADLSPHRDRPQCHFTVSLLLDYRANERRTRKASPWKLWIERRKGGGGTPFSQRPGDALLYLGTELAHWRDRLPAGASSSSLLLHYVPSDFSGSLD